MGLLYQAIIINKQKNSNTYITKWKAKSGTIVDLVGLRVIFQL